MYKNLKQKQTTNGDESLIVRVPGRMVKGKEEFQREWGPSWKGGLVSQCRMSHVMGTRAYSI